MVYSGFKHNCFDYSSSGSTNITAQSPGTQYNASISNAQVASFPEVTANGSASGGTDNMVQVVSQQDIDTATSKISADASGVKQDLANQLQGQGLYPIEVTFASGQPSTSSNPNVGDASNTVTVTETITYTMYGASQNDLNAVLTANINSQIQNGQNIITTGLSQAGFSQVSSNANTDQVTLSTIAEVGPNISITQVKKQAAGKSAQAIVQAVKNDPDITSVSVKFSPFWVTSAPSDVNKITVNIAKPSKTV